MAKEVSKEIERTFLASSLPAYKLWPAAYVLDIYYPIDSIKTPYVRLRQKDNLYMITKKQPLVEGDWSQFMEHTIYLDEEEFRALATAPGRRVAKWRFSNGLSNGIKIEVDVFEESLKGLVIIDFEFHDEATARAFKIPPYCLAEITQGIIDGGWLAGKTLAGIEPVLKRYGYQPFFENR